MFFGDLFPLDRKLNSSCPHCYSSQLNNHKLGFTLEGQPLADDNYNMECKTNELAQKFDDSLFRKTEESLWHESSKGHYFVPVFIHELFSKTYVT